MVNIVPARYDPFGGGKRTDDFNVAALSSDEGPSSQRSLAVALGARHRHPTGRKYHPETSQPTIVAELVALGRASEVLRLGGPQPPLGHIGSATRAMLPRSDRPADTRHRTGCGSKS